MVTGRYDMVAIGEAPDEGVMARALLSITSKAASPPRPVGRSLSRSTARSSAACHRNFRTQAITPLAAHPTTPIPQPANSAQGARSYDRGGPFLNSRHRRR